MNDWRPISELTDDHVRDAHHLLLGNSCNGPWHPDPEFGIACFYSADIIRSKTPWTHFMAIQRIEDDPAPSFSTDNH